MILSRTTEQCSKGRVRSALDLRDWLNIMPATMTTKRRPRGSGGIIYRGKGSKRRMYVRVRYKDASGQVRDKLERVYSKSEVGETVHDLRQDLKVGGERVFTGAKLTFRELATLYAKSYHMPAMIVEGTKVSGLKSLRSSKMLLANLVAYFGERPIRSITYEDIKRFKQERLQTPAVWGLNTRGTSKAGNRTEKQRSVASVHREIEELRKVLRFATSQRWLLHNPLTMGAPLINKADEKKRIRILTHDEEARLLQVCVGKREHLAGFLVVAIDTFMRAGELMKLKRKDVDFRARTVRVVAENSKTNAPRIIGLTSRALLELEKLSDCLAPDDLLFTCGNVKRSFKTACRLAQIEGMRVHDLRHTGITRRLEAAARAGVPWQLVMKESGHTNTVTFMRYFNPDVEMMNRAADAMDLIREETTKEQRVM
jgi:integrase